MLYFIEKNAPLLEPWQREIVRIVRKIAQYFYPQRQTQVMNEGWATFWHYTLLNTLYDEGLLDRRLHDRVPEARTPTWCSSRRSTHRGYSGINPYALGFAMFTDLQAHLRDADRRGPRSGSRTSPARDWLQDARLRDAQLQGRELHRPVPVAEADARVRACSRSSTTSTRRELEVAAIHDDSRLPPRARGAVAPVRPRHRASPNIQVWNVNLRGDRSLTLRHTRHNDRPLDDGAQEVLKHVARLWGFGVHLESVDKHGDVTTHGR